VSDSIVSIKGTGDGLLVTVGNGSWEAVEVALVKMIETRRDFFRGAEIALQVGDRVLEREDIRKLKDRLAEHDVTLRAVLGESAETARSARRLDLEAELEANQPVPTHEPNELPEIKSDVETSSAVLIRQTLRNGRTVRHTGHVVVIGDVNPGAQVIAGGDVLVWGRLRGTVHAGALGDANALVCALDLRPMQLRIANHVAVGADGGHGRPHPEIAFVRDGQIVAEEWGHKE
jgi:septum site-determining protein MinC